MEAQSAVWDEIADRLVVIYNHMRLCRADIAQADKTKATATADLAALEAKASHYEALLASDTEGITA